MRIQYLRLMFVFAATAWLINVVVRLLTVPNQNPNPSAFVYCVLLVGVLPSALGYGLLFKALPWAGRRLRRG
jgi:hypothetical protein